MVVMVADLGSCDARFGHVVYLLCIVRLKVAVEILSCVSFVFHCSKFFIISGSPIF
jgi:hypothetical protein